MNTTAAKHGAGGPAGTGASWMEARYPWVLTLAGLALVVVTVNAVVGRVPSASLNIYVVQPMLWLGLGLAALVLWRRDGSLASLRGRGAVVGVAAILAVFQIAIAVLFGMLAGFGRSPYAHAPQWLLLNLWFVLARVTGIELARWHVLRTLSARRPHVGMLVAFATGWIAAIPFAAVTHTSGLGAWLDLGGRLLLPLAVESAGATYLTMAGGPIPSIVYRGILVAVAWSSPILPDFTWPLAAFVGVVGPILGLAIAQDLVEESDDPMEQKGSGVSVGWVMTAAVVVTAFWFQTGLFGVRPAITTGVSMEPYLHTGDLAITREVDPSSIAVGDVIRFQQHGRAILHRVIEIRRENGQLMFITRGDNNNTADNPVQPSEIQGRLVLRVPNAGWAPIYAKRLLSLLL